MPRSPFYAPRRVPQAFPPGYMRLRILPLLPGIGANAIVSTIVDSAVVPENLRPLMRERVNERGAAILERAQRIFFDEPGLDTLLIRGVAVWSRRLTALGRTYLRARIALGADRSGRAAAMLPLVPRKGYDSLMTSMLATGTALGAFRGGEVHAQAFYDSGIASPRGPHLALPEGHPEPGIRRFEPPTLLGDLAADIDDLYWAEAHGQPVKITRVGHGETRRWLVSLPGTDHVNPQSTVNPADTETNIREVLNVPSAMRIGVVNALHQAMGADGIAHDERLKERVLICGHSQGGMVAAALGALDPAEVGVRVSAVLTLGTPSRRLRIRPDVVMVAVEHDQDVVPSVDGTPARALDQRVTISRRLVRPRQGPLYYAHSSSTYTETVRQAERKAAVAPWGRASNALVRLQEYLPSSGEEVRVSFYDIWQDLLEPTTADTWDTYVDIDRPQWEAVSYTEEWTPNPLIELRHLDVDLPDLHELQALADERVGELKGDMVAAAQDFRGAVERVIPGITRVTSEPPGGDTSLIDEGDADKEVDDGRS